MDKTRIEKTDCHLSIKTQGCDIVMCKSPTLALSHLGCIINIHLCPITSGHQPAPGPGSTRQRRALIGPRCRARPPPAQEGGGAVTRNIGGDGQTQPGCILLSRYNHIAINIQGNMREGICLIMTCKTSFICFTRKVSVFKHSDFICIYCHKSLININKCCLQISNLYLCFVDWCV